MNNGYIYLFQVKTMKFCPLKSFYFTLFFVSQGKPQLTLVWYGHSIQPKTIFCTNLEIMFYRFTWHHSLLCFRHFSLSVLELQRCQGRNLLVPLSGINVPIPAQICPFWWTKFIKTCTRLSVKSRPCVPPPPLPPSCLDWIQSFPTF